MGSWLIFLIYGRVCRRGLLRGRSRARRRRHAGACRLRPCGAWGRASFGHNVFGSLREAGMSSLGRLQSPPSGRGRIGAKVLAGRPVSGRGSARNITPPDDFSQYSNNRVSTVQKSGASRIATGNRTPTEVGVAVTLGRVIGCNLVGLARTKRRMMRRERKASARYDGGGSRVPWQRDADRRGRLAASKPRPRTENPELARLRSKKDRLKRQLKEHSEGTSEPNLVARDYEKVSVCA